MTRSSSTGWFVYMVACNDGSLYTGITTDLERRTREHNTGKGAARYTRSRRPVRLVYRENAENRSEAAKREYRIKKMTADEKRKLIARLPGFKGSRGRGIK